MYMQHEKGAGTSRKGTRMPFLQHKMSWY